MISVVHLMTYPKGGAANAAMRLHNSLLEVGVDSNVFTSIDGGSSNNGVITPEGPRHLLGKIQRRICKKLIQLSHRSYEANKSQDLELFSTAKSFNLSHFISQIPDADIYNLHWIGQEFLDYELFFEFLRKKSKPLVWTLHDMNPFTGGCHYSLGCQKFVQQCGNCPLLKSNRESDLSRKVYEIKSRSFHKLPVQKFLPVAPSRWLVEQAQSSSLFKRFTVENIPYGLNLQVFQPRETSGLRSTLSGGNPDMKFLLFTAEHITNRRKGFASFVAAVVEISQTLPITILALGASNEKSISENLKLLHLGFIKDEKLLSYYYSLADVFVIPSIEDNLPNTVLESMACGTPVVGCNVGGIPDMIEHGRTGRLCKPGDTADLARQIVHLLERPEELKQLGLNCRKVALSQYEAGLQAGRYGELYEKLLDTAWKI